MLGQVSHALKMAYDKRHGEYASEAEVEPTPEQLASALLGATIRQVSGSPPTLGLPTAGHSPSPPRIHHSTDDTQWFKVEHSQDSIILNAQIVEVKRRGEDYKVRSASVCQFTPLRDSLTPSSPVCQHLPHTDTRAPVCQQLPHTGTRAPVCQQLPHTDTRAPVRQHLPHTDTRAPVRTQVLCAWDDGDSEWLSQDEALQMIAACREGGVIELSNMTTGEGCQGTKKVRPRALMPSNHCTRPAHLRTQAKYVAKLNKTCGVLYAVYSCGLAVSFCELFGAESATQA